MLNVNVSDADLPRRGERTLLKPAFSRRTAALCTAWNGVGDAFTKLRKRVAASGLDP